MSEREVKKDRRERGGRGVIDKGEREREREKRDSE